MATKRKSKEKRLGDRRTTDRRAHRRRLAKSPVRRNARSASRRRTDRRGGVRRQGDTYLAKIEEFKGLAKPSEALPPLEEEITDLPEIVDDSESPANEELPDPTDPDLELENS